MAEFRIPIRILYGDGTLEHISGLRGDRMLLVHDCEAACRIAQKQARRTGMHIRVFSVPEGPVDGPTVLEGAKALMEFKPGWIIAIGGMPPWTAQSSCGYSTSVPTLLRTILSGPIYPE